MSRTSITILLEPHRLTHDVDSGRYSCRNLVFTFMHNEVRKRGSSDVGAYLHQY